MVQTAKGAPAEAAFAEGSRCTLLEHHRLPNAQGGCGHSPVELHPTLGSHREQLVMGRKGDSGLGRKEDSLAPPLGLPALLAARWPLACR